MNSITGTLPTELQLMIMDYMDFEKDCPNLRLSCKSGCELVNLFACEKLRKIGYISKNYSEGWQTVCQLNNLLRKLSVSPLTLHPSILWEHHRIGKIFLMSYNSSISKSLQNKNINTIFDLYIHRNLLFHEEYPRGMHNFQCLYARTFNGYRQLRFPDHPAGKILDSLTLKWSDVLLDRGEFEDKDSFNRLLGALSDSKISWTMTAAVSRSYKVFRRVVNQIDTRKIDYNFDDLWIWLDPYTDFKVIEFIEDRLKSNLQSCIASLVYAPTVGLEKVKFHWKKLCQKFPDIANNPSMIFCQSDQMFWGPLHIAALLNKPEVIKYLIKKGFNVNVICSSATPLDYALMAGAYEAAKTLLELGAKLEDSFEHAYKPLIAIAVSGKIELIDLIYQERCSYFEKIISDPEMSARRIIDYFCCSNPDQKNQAVNWKEKLNKYSIL